MYFYEGRKCSALYSGDGGLIAINNKLLPICRNITTIDLKIYTKIYNQQAKDDITMSHKSFLKIRSASDDGADQALRGSISQANNVDNFAPS